MAGEAFVIWLSAHPSKKPEYILLHSPNFWQCIDAVYANLTGYFSRFRRKVLEKKGIIVQAKSLTFGENMPSELAEQIRLAAWPRKETGLSPQEYAAVESAQKGALLYVDESSCGGEY